MAKYNIIKNHILGKGRFCVVYKAISPTEGKEYAMKRYKEVLSLEAREDYAFSFIRELSILQQLPPHPSIVCLRDVVDSGGNTFDLVMDKACTDLHVSQSVVRSHGTTHARIHSDGLLLLHMQRVLMASFRVDNYLSNDHVRRIFSQIVEGVHHLHRHGIIHRDLKPSNILMNLDCTIKIADFGMACDEMGTMTRRQEKVQNPFYRAPEFFFNMNKGKAMDMWTVGVILAEICLCSDMCPRSTRPEHFPLMAIANERAMNGEEDEDLRRQVIRRIFEVVPMSSQVFTNTITEQVIYSFRNNALGVHRDTQEPRILLDIPGDEDLMEILQKCLMLDSFSRMTSWEAMQALGLEGITRAKPLLLPRVPQSFEQFKDIVNVLVNNHNNSAEQ